MFIEEDLIKKIPESGGVIRVLMGDYGAWDLAVSPFGENVERKN